MTLGIPIALTAIAGLSLWVCSRVARRPVPGRQPFAWLSAAIALWCATAAVHAVVFTLEAQMAIAKVQYLAVATVAPLWLLFAAQYAGLERGSHERDVPGDVPPRGRRYVRLLWVIPAITVVAAATNEWHHALWSSVTITPAGVTVYTHAWWFYFSTAYSYILLTVGTVLIARRLVQSPPIFRAQLATIIGASAFPWLGNVLYLGGWRPGGVDFTPLGFGFSTLLFAWALYRNQLFDLVPVARELVIDSLHDAMIVLDASRRIVDMNAAARELAHRKGTIGSGGRWLGRRLDTVFPVLEETPLETASGLVTSRMVWTAGEPAWFQVEVLPVRARGGTWGAWVILLRDVTRQRQAEAERDALRERVQQQQRRESLSILAGGLAHDFNNLLTGIVGNADLLRMALPASSRLGESVGAIQLGAQRAADLVSKMLAYAGERRGTAERVDLDALTRDLLDLLRASAARHCSVYYEGCETIIHADPIQIRQIVMNLVINAADAVGEGTGRIDVRTSVETLTPCELAGMRFGQEAEPGEYARLEVRDNGCGMTAATLERIFQPFFTTRPEGHGLGLAAVQGIVLGHRGAMAVESEPGRGSRFRIWLPLSPADADAETPQAGPPGREQSLEMITSGS